MTATPVTCSDFALGHPQGKCLGLACNSADRCYNCMPSYDVEALKTVFKHIDDEAAQRKLEAVKKLKRITVTLTENSFAWANHLMCRGFVMLSSANNNKYFIRDGLLHYYRSQDNDLSNLVYVYKVEDTQPGWDAAKSSSWTIYCGPEDGNLK